MTTSRIRVLFCLSVFLSALTLAKAAGAHAADEAGEDQLLFDGSQKLSGVTIAADPDDAGNDVASWTGATKGHRLALVQKTIDLSAQEALSFRFYSAQADGHGIVIICDSNEPGGEGSYYHVKFVVDWEGWKDVVIPLSAFSSSRTPAGWQKIDKILFANSGYHGTKPNPEANYLIDDVVALAEKPAVEPMAKDQALELSTINGSHTARFEIDPSQEHIYGIRYEIKGESGAEVRLRQYRTYTESDALRHKYEVIGHHWDPVVTDGWETRRHEFLTKKGSAAIELDFNLKGDQPLALRNIEVVKGGFPDDPPLAEAPYLDWIESLQPDMSNAKGSPLLDFAPGGTGLYDSKNYNVYVDATEQAKLEKEVAPYLELSVQELIDLVPTQRPFEFKPHWGADYTWTPDKPEQVFDAKTGELFDWEKQYPIQGYEEVVAPSGNTVRYAYHDTDLSDKKYEGQRIYVERFLNDARTDALFRAGYGMAGLYRKNGDMEYGVRSAAIFWAMWRGTPDWPVHGRPAWNSPKVDRHMVEPDFYEWFSFVIDGDWYVNNTGILGFPARYFDLIRDQQPVWDALATQQAVNVSDPRMEAAEGLLHLAEQIMIRDAYHRTNEFVFFHNLSGSANRSLIQLGRTLGIPDLTHYGLHKVEGAFRTRFMSDGVFPESMWYTGDQFARQSEALNSLQEYTDPAGYECPWDGQRLDVKNPTDSVATYGSVKDAIDRQYYPDGSRHTIHDSWAESANDYKADLEGNARKEVSPYLFRAYGHAILGRGQEPHRIESHLHFSGRYNHGHYDMLNLILWANGDELASDIGYTHISRFGTSTLSHNLVVIDQSVQSGGSGEGDLLMWDARKGSPQVVQAAQGESKVYEQADLYRRSLVMLPFGEDQTAVLDIFEVKGGSRHDWMANGNADYPQQLTSDLKPDETLDNLGLDGEAMKGPGPGGGDSDADEKMAEEKVGSPSYFYGAFRNAKVTRMDMPWSATMSPGKQATDADAWAGGRAKSTDPKPSLRLHWLGPVEGKAILAEGPRNRYFNELKNKPAAREAWADLRMPKIIVSREGDNLDSTFVAAWEPFNQQPFLESAAAVKLSEGEGMGWELGDGKTTYQVLYQPNEDRGTVGTDTLTSDGRFAIRGTTPDGVELNLYGGRVIEDQSLAIRVQAAAQMPVTALSHEGDTFVMTVEAPSGDGSGDVRYDAAEGEYVRFSQAGHNNRWFRIDRIESSQGQLRLTLADDPGFTFDADADVLRETYFPHRVTRGKATVALPAWVNARISQSTDTTELFIRSSGTTELTLKNHGNSGVQIQSPQPDDNGSWESLPATTSGSDLQVVVRFDEVSSQWTQLRIKKN